MAEQDEKDDTWPEELVEIKMKTSCNFQAQREQNVRRAFKQEDSACPEEVIGEGKYILFAATCIDTKQTLKFI